MNLTIYAPYIAGGVLIGTAASLLLIGNGRIAGISGIYRSVVGGTADNTARLFLLGLLISPWLAPLLKLQMLPVSSTPQSWLKLIGAGLLVGIGTHIGNGCTSGHGVCGLANFSPRSLVATLIFMVIAALVVALGFGGVL